MTNTMIRVQPKTRHRLNVEKAIGNYQSHDDLISAMLDAWQKGRREMNAQLTDLLEKHNAEFNWNGETWCLSGPARGNGNVWETDDYEAASREQAEQDAADYLTEYHAEYPEL